MRGDGKGEGETLEALRRAEQNFRTLIERAPLPMSFSRPDRLVYVNPAMLDYLGYADTEGMISPSLAELSDELIHPEDRARTREAFAHLFAELSHGQGLEAGGSVHIDDVRLRRKSDGALRFCDMHGVIVLHDGAPALVTYLYDHTDRKEAVERMRLADRMASLGTLAAGVAHEINNPLTYVMGNVELLGRCLAHSERAGEVAQHLGHVRSGLERIREIVRAMKTFSRGDEDTIGPVYVTRALEACIQMAQSHLRHRGRLVRDFADVPPVRGNEARLGQVFLNLLVNAAEALDEGTFERNEVVVTVRSSGDDVVVDVRDNGAGIAAEDLPHIFEPFFTTKPVDAGTGLGLFVCHGIVSALGGEVSVRSAVGEGTSVCVRLPIATSDPRTAEAPSPRTSRRRGRILVVDDEPRILDLVRALLEAEHDVTTLSSAEDALERILSGDCYHLVLCDLMMPQMTGAEFYARLAAASPHLAQRVVFMTGGAVTASTAGLFAGTANRRLEKPFSAAELLDLVHRDVTLASDSE